MEKREVVMDVEVHFDTDLEPYEGVARLTYPRFRDVLERAREGHDDTARAVIARVGERAVGLSLTTTEGDVFLLRSLFVHPAVRNRGIGTRLLELTQQDMGSNIPLFTQYVVDGETAKGIDRLLCKCGWETPIVVGFLATFDPREAIRSPMLSKQLSSRLGRGFSIVPWSRVNRQDLDAVAESDRKSKWIDAGLEPWRWSVGADPASRALFAMGRGMVGWAFVHRASPVSASISCSFVEAEHARRGRIQPIWRSCIESLATQGVERCTLITYRHQPMFSFLAGRRHRLSFLDIQELKSSKRDS